MVEQLETRVVPMWIEHDPRIPPRGRIIDAEVREREDEEYELVGVVEVYEEEDFQDGERVPKLDRTIPTVFDEGDRDLVFYNRRFEEQDDQRDINEIARILDADPQKKEKRSAELLAVLELAGKFTLGAIASGFFGKIGADAYDALKSKIKEVMARKAEEEDEHLLVFNPVVEVDGRLVEVQVILTNPSDKEIEAFFEDGLPELDEVLPLHTTHDTARRIVYEYENRTVQLKFGVREDGVPLFPSEKNS